MILFPTLLAFLVAPSHVEWSTTIYADLPMGYLVAVAALLLILWIEERKPWQLASATLLLAGAMLTKREGMLFVVCVLLSAFVVFLARDRRPSRQLVVAGLAAFALILPWRVWFTAHGLPATASDTGYDGPVSDYDRLWPAVEMSVRTLFHEPFWHIAPVIGVAAILLAALGRAWTCRSTPARCSSADWQPWPGCSGSTTGWLSFTKTGLSAGWRGRRF